MRTGHGVAGGSVTDNHFVLVQAPTELWKAIMS
jgi:hypothetical protein